MLHLSCFDCLVEGIIYCTFSDSSVVSLKSSPWPKYTLLRTIFQIRNRVPLSNFLYPWNMFFVKLFLANTWKNRGSPCSFKRKGEFISFISLREISYVLYVHARNFAMVLDKMIRANKLTQLEGPRDVGGFGENGEFGKSNDFGEISPRLSTKWSERIN